MKRLHAHESSKMLGIWIAPNGNKTTLISELKNEVIKGNASPTRERAREQDFSFF